MTKTICKDKRVAIYARVSTQDQDTDRQVRDLTALADRAGYQVIEVFTEQASGGLSSRPLRSQVIDLARQRLIDAVLVTELTRWGRSTVDLLDTLQELHSCGVSLIAQSGDQMDLSTAQGKMIAGVLAVLAQFERDLISERTKSGLAAARARGTKLGRPTGNRTDSKHRAAILDMHRAGLSYRDIASKLKISKDTIGRVIKISG